MNDQLESLQKIFAALPEEALQETVATMESHGRLFVYGAGRSGLMLKALAMRLAQAGRTVYAVGEVVTPAIEKGDLLILASASGTTPSVCRCAETARAVGATVLTVSATEDTPLARLSDRLLLLPAPTKDQAQNGTIMGTLFEQALLLLGDLLVSMMNVDPAQMRARHANLE